MSGISRASSLLTDDSAIHFIDGTVVKGAKEVTELVRKCCVAYNEGYKWQLSRFVTRNLGIGIGIGVVAGVSYQIYKYKKMKTKKLEGET